MSKPKQISFCIPVYNVEKYLNDCIQSIYDQPISDFEIICADDCSTDGSLSELKRLADIHREIVIIRNEENKGLSATRNLLLKTAAGEYVWFVDADDKLIPKTTNHFINIAKKTDANAVLGNYIVFLESGPVPEFCQGNGDYETVSFSEVDRFFPTNEKGDTNFGVWNGIYKRSFLIENNISFLDGLPIWEDVLFDVEFGIKSQKIIRTNYYGYYYRIRQSSITHSSSLLFYFIESAKIVLPAIKQKYSITPEFENTYRPVMAKLERTCEIALVRISDTKYVRDNFKFLKENGFYPYDTAIKAEMLKSHWKYSFICRVLRIEAFFWIIHYANKLMSKVAELFKSGR